MSLRFRVPALCILLASAAPVVGQTTPEAFVSELQSFYTKLGYSMEIGSREQQGDALVLRDVTFSATTPQMTAKATTASIEVRPITEPGYELAMVFAPVYEATITMAVDAATATPIPEIRVTAEIPGNMTRIGGMPGDRTYALTAEAMRMTLAPFAVDPAGGTMQFTAALQAPAMTYSLKEGTEGRMTYDGTASDLVLALSVTGPDGDAKVDATYRGIAFKGANPIVDFSDPLAIYKSEATTDIALRTQSSESAIRVVDQGQTLDASSVTGPGELHALIGKGMIDYSVEGRDTVINVAGDAMPFPPVSLKAGVMGFRIAFPLLPRDVSSEAAFDLTLRDLTVGEELWAMVDPAQGLPRDPATLVVRLSSAARVLVSFLDPEAMAGAQGAPIVFDDVKIREVSLRIAGAEISATGDAVINNDGPMPMPVGGADISLTGLVALIGKLGELGLIPPPIAMQAPAMLGVFAKPGSAPDTFTSRIEMTAEGQITANGVPVQ
jgi:hypothetical protein